MPRKTRAAAKAQNVLPESAPEEVEEPGAEEEEKEEASAAPLLPPAPSQQDSRALRNTTPNGSEIAETQAPVEGEMKRSKGRKGKGKKKGKKAKAEKVQNVPEQVEAVAEQPEAAEEQPEVAEEQPEVAETAAEPIVETQDATPAERPVSPKPQPERMTRQRLALAEAEQSKDTPKDDSLETSDPLSEAVETTDALVDGDAVEAQEEPILEPEEPAVQESADSESAPAVTDEGAVPEQADAIAPEEAEDSKSIAVPEPEPEDPQQIVVPSAGPEDFQQTVASSAEPEDSPPVAVASAEPEDSQPAVTLDAGPEDLVEPASNLQPLNNEISPALSLTQPEDPIDAKDALEDAIEEVGKILPELDAPTPMKSRVPRASPRPSLASAATSAPQGTKLSSSVAGTALSKSLIGRGTGVRTAASNKLVNSTQPTSAARTRAPPTSSTANSISRSRSTSTRSRPPSVTAQAPAVPAVKAPDYLATKRRPISLQFPTPPPAPKSSKLPTRAAFQLPGDAIAAKLKAQRQERLKREEEEAAKRKAFKGRPVAKPARPVDIKQPATIRPRVIGIGGVDTTDNKENGTTGGLKRSMIGTATTGSTVKPGSTIGGSLMRSSVMGPAPAAAPKITAANTAQKRNSTAFAANKDSSVSVSKRQPGALPISTAKRVSSIPQLSPSAKPKASMPAQDVAVQRFKGKEVFNRDRMGKEAKERERREKDEALKTARAQAAERGRQASRDWAEKQKKALAEKRGLAHPTDIEPTFV